MTTERAEMASYSGPTENLSELRITLLGFKMSGKSSSGNTILGSEQFKLERTAQCEKRHGVVVGRKVTVINTPGWWMNESPNETPELIKQEIVRSASLCHPGPNALLLVLRADFSNYKSVEDHMQLLGERVWSHTMPLFTFGESLGDRSIEQYIESGGEALQRLVDKCGNRYHVFSNKNRGDDTQVTELLEKIEEMVAEDRGGCFEIDRRVLEETEKKRTKRRQMTMKKERKSVMGYWSPSIPAQPVRKSQSKDFPPFMSEAEQIWTSRSSLSGATSGYDSQSSIYSPYSSKSSIHSAYGSQSSIYSPHGTSKSFLNATIKESEPRTQSCRMIRPRSIEVYEESKLRTQSCRMFRGDMRS